MRILRNRFFVRTSASFFIIVILQSSFLSSYSWALTSGTHQTEYISYEDPGSTDMVNLLTGDFTTSLPLLEVPGPEGGFSVPLSYHAGIGIEQEASWVGLGWTLNPGAITRNINQYPDDANGGTQNVAVQNLTGITGWGVQYLSPLKESWNSQTGFYGNVNFLDVLEIEYGNKRSVGIAGFHVGSEGASFNAQQFINTVMIVATLGSGSFAVAAKQIGIQLAVSAATSFAAAALSSNVQSSSSSGYWQSSHHATKSLIYNPKKAFFGFGSGFGIKKKEKYWLDQSRNEKMYGTLYLGLADVEHYTQDLSNINNGAIVENTKNFALNYNTSDGATSDINFEIDASKEYMEQNSATTLAYDQYQVNAAGVSGIISPYRMDLGSVSMPRKMSQGLIRIAQVPYLDYKIPFIYPNDATNSYLHHFGSETTVGAPTDYYGLNAIVHTDQFQRLLFYEFTMKDQIFRNERIRSDLNTTKRVAQGKNIEWLNVDDIKASATYTSGYLDPLPFSERANFRGDNNLTGIGGKTIGAYVITGENGMNYHFGTPIYDYDSKNEMIDANDANIKNSITRSSPYANTWLLTAVTGPDFIDRNSNGQADEGDWGYWVKLNYGKHTNIYDWAIPFQGTMLDPTSKVKSSSSGKKQMYYLNSIETRSHVALMLKGIRGDGRSVNNGVYPLKLDEIVLLTRGAYNNLIQTYGTTYNFSDKWTTMCQSILFSGDVRTFINQNAIKRTLFNYDYTLCPGTTNALGTDNPSHGKLTLKSVSVRGRNDARMFPDFKFDYENNPTYDANKWDGWGMYNINGTASPDSHKVSTPISMNAWCLTKITTPLGSDINIEYERDSYSSVSGYQIYGNSFPFSEYRTQVPPITGFNTYTVSHNGYFNVGDKVRVDGTWSYTCPTNSQYYSGTSFSDATITSVSGNVIMVNANSGQGYQCMGTNVNVSFSGTIKKVENKKLGGNNRVASISLTDQGKVFKTRYLYTDDDNLNSSSGVVAQEPDYIKNGDLDFYNRLGYPQTPVMYKKVTVLQGRLNDDTDFDSKQVFRFRTLTPDDYTISETVMDQVLTYVKVFKRYYRIDDKSSKVGAISSIELFDKAGTSVSKTDFTYSDQVPNTQGKAYQGYFSQGVLLSDKEGMTDAGLLKLNRTTVLDYPNVLQKVVTTKDGMSSESENLKWDFLSGSVVEKITRSSLGVNVKSVIQPAYLEYPEMGSKALSSSNKNMLSQVAATYEYKTDVSGNPIGLISAEAQTWSKDWPTYRVLGGGVYSDSDDGAVTAGQGVWRTYESYSWLGDYGRLQKGTEYLQDGIQNFSPGDQFNFTANATNAGWKKTGTVTRYDHYSMPLESKDMNGLYASLKMGYGDQMKIAEITNGSYSEMAFSGAEDLNSTSGFFGGEVALGSGTVITTIAHTGSNALQLSSGYGFIFKPSGLTNRSYRASAWSNSANGRIYYKVNNTEYLSSAPTRQAGDWYQINIDNIPSGATEVGVKSASGTVVFDDFRFQPLNAGMTAYVYKPSTGELDYLLDNNNLFIRYEYNDRGQLTKKYQESFKSGVKLVSESRDNYRRFHVNQ